MCVTYTKQTSPLYIPADYTNVRGMKKAFPPTVPSCTTYICVWHVESKPPHSTLLYSIHMCVTCRRHTSPVYIPVNYTYVCDM